MEMSAPDWEELKADGRVVVDAPARKLAVYSNPDGHVVMLSVEWGKTHYALVEPHEVPALMRALQRAKVEASEDQRRRDAEYETFQTIEKAKGA